MYNLNHLFLYQCYFSDLNCFDFAKDHLAGGVGEINPMSEFMPHRNPSALKQSTITTTTPPPSTTLSSDESENSLEYLLEQLKKMPYSDNNSAKPTPLKQHLNKESRHQATLQHYEDILSELFSTFKRSFNKNYGSHHEHERRKDIYRHNMR